MSILFNKVVHDRQFNFQPLEFGEEAGYHVDVKDEENTRWEFRIFRTDGKWKIEGEKVPSWIFDIEPELGKAIDEHE
jgi:hypothetical protein